MTILVFWQVGSYDVERHTLDNVSDIDAFDVLWHKRDELNARFYDMTERGIGNFYLMGDPYDFEQDYNDEELDGGQWTKVLRIDEDYVKQIIEE